MSKLRTRTVSTRLNPEELALLDQWCGNMSRGRWVRNRLFHRQPAIPAPVNRQQWAALGKVGSNINQIARRFNSGDLPELEGIREALADLRSALLNASTTTRNEENERDE